MRRDEALRVLGVVDREVRLHAQRLRLAPEDPHARGVERAHPHDPRPLADEVLTVLHGGSHSVHTLFTLVGAAPRGAEYYVSRRVYESLKSRPVNAAPN